MRLYPRMGQTVVHDPERGHFEATEDGGFDLPEDLAEKLHRFHVAGRPMWETDIERQHRLMAEELERRRDPATLMEAVQQLVDAAKATTPAAPATKPDASAKKTTRKTTSPAAS